MKVGKLKELRTPFRAYAVEEVLGEGANGIVVAARDEDGLACAIKILRPSASTKKRKRFQNELFFCLRTEHKNILRVLDFGTAEADGEAVPFFVMPRFDLNLREAMKAGLAPDEALLLFAGILDGVEAAHLRNVWHRDLKPENILLSRDRKAVVVSDFGIAHFQEEELATAVETQAGEKLANFQYASPEQLRLTAAEGPADVYALGLMLNELLTGERPHGTDFRKISQAYPPWLAMDALVHEMRQQDPSRRPDVATIKRELSRITDAALAQQALDAVRNQVVPAADATLPERVKIARVDWHGGQLEVFWEKRIDNNWPEILKKGNYPHGELGGIGPEHLQVGLTSALIPASENQAPKMLKLVESWVHGANERYEELLRAEAKKREREEQERHNGLMRAMEKRTEVLSKLKLGA